MPPLNGFRIVEIAGIGPGPFCAMMLADMGAEVLRVDRIARPRADVPADHLLRRGRRSVAINLKHPDGVETFLRLAEQADAVIEGFRAGVAERLGIGPEACMQRNPRLVYGRVTGWGQDGPLAQAAGSDINYIALAGALAHVGRASQAPVTPLNLVGDLGGGGLLLAFGMLCALLERERSGVGQVVDAATVDGATLLMTMSYSMRHAGQWRHERGVGLADSGPPFYDVYETADGRYITVGAIAHKFYDELVALCGIDVSELPPRSDREAWSEIKASFAGLFKTKTQAEWCNLLEGTDACFAPVLSMDEAPNHAQNQVRGTFMELDGVVQPAPAPRFSRTPAQVHLPPPREGQHTTAALALWGFTDDDIRSLREKGAIGPEAPGVPSLLSFVGRPRRTRSRRLGNSPETRTSESEAGDYRDVGAAER